MNNKLFKQLKKEIFYNGLLACKSKNNAIKALCKAGICDNSGNINKQYK